jgi:YIF1
VLLLAPFLRKYDYMRQVENMATAVPTMKPPRDDLFAPDLYVPLHAVFTYVVLSACNRFIAGTFQPDVMYNMVRHAAACPVSGV